MTPLNSERDWYLWSSYVPRKKGVHVSAKLAVSHPQRMSFDGQ